MRFRTSPRGRVTPGDLMLLALLAGGGWFVSQAGTDRTSMVCGVVDKAAGFAKGDGSVHSEFDLKLRGFLESLHTKCPEVMDTQLTPLVEKGKEKAGKVVHTTLTEGGKIKDQRGIAVLDGRTLKIDGVGKAHLLGITIPSETEEATRGYLVNCCDGHRLVVEQFREKDAEGYALVVVYLEQEGVTTNQYAVNQHLLDRRLATPWTIPVRVDHWANR